MEKILSYIFRIAMLIIIIIGVASFFGYIISIILIIIAIVIIALSIIAGGFDVEESIHNDRRSPKD